MTIAALIEKRDGDIAVATPEMTVREVVALLADRRIGAVPVVEDGRVVGIFSERDVIYGLRRSGAALMDASVAEVMTEPAITASRDMSGLSALALMTQRRVRHLPVIEDGALVGFVSIGDLVKMRIDRMEAEASAMRDYIQAS